MKMNKIGVLAGILLTVSVAGSSAFAASCGNNASGFNAWKSAFANEAKAAGVKNKGLQALAGSSYASKTIAYDRNQKSFKYSLDKFMQVRGADAIASKGRKKKAASAGFFKSIESKYGVPAGPLLAIIGMETNFGSYMGNQNIVDAAVTMTYDCRRSDFFRPHAIAALKLVDRGVISKNSVGAAHAELSPGQFLAGNFMKYGVDGDGGGVSLKSNADAMASIANYLRAHGWKRGAGYQPGEPNFRAIQAWNAAGVYQKAIAIIAAKIDQ